MRTFVLPAVFHVLAEGVEIPDFQDASVVESNRAVPETVYLVAVHTHDADVQIAVVVIEGLHAQVEAAVLRQKMPGFEESVRFGEGFDVHGTDLMGLAVVEEAGFGGAGLVADAPGELEAEEVPVPASSVHQAG